MLRKLKTTEEEYFELSYRKTACLFSACMRLGAILGRQSEGLEMKLGSYGINLGLAFQLVDDLLDFTSSEEKLGKPVGSDLREGKLTLPLIYLLEHATAEETAKVQAVLDEGGFRSVQFQEVLEMMERHGALERARAKARDLAEQAREALRSFADSPYKDALRSLPEFILEREF
jgi:octaprenyl-diphosphate synthase